MLVVNAARKEADLAHLRRHLGSEVAIEPQFERALLALQGPAAAAVLARLAGDGVARMNFMSAAETDIAGAPCFVTRSGYTGEDGFELSLAADDAVAVAEALLRRAGGRADRARRARHAASRSRAVPLRSRHRRDDDPGRGRSCLDDRQTPPRSRRFSGRRDDPASACRGAVAETGRHPSGWPRPGARGHGDNRCGRQPGRPGHERRFRPVGRGADRDGLCRCPRMPPRARRWRLSSATCRGRRGSRGCRSSRPAITAADSNTVPGGNE